MSARLRSITATGDVRAVARRQGPGLLERRRARVHPRLERQLLLGAEVPPGQAGRLGDGRGLAEGRPGRGHVDRSQHPAEDEERLAEHRRLTGGPGPLDGAPADPFGDRPARPGRARPRRRPRRCGPPPPGPARCRPPRARPRWRTRRRRVDRRPPPPGPPRRGGRLRRSALAPLADILVTRSRPSTRASAGLPAAPSTWTSTSSASRPTGSDPPAATSASDRARRAVASAVASAPSTRARRALSTRRAAAAV